MTVADPTQASRQRRQDTSGVPDIRRIRIYQHSDLMYWWVVWLYGFFLRWSNISRRK